MPPGLTGNVRAGSPPAVDRWERSLKRAGGSVTPPCITARKSAPVTDNLLPAAPSRSTFVQTAESETPLSEPSRSLRNPRRDRSAVANDAAREEKSELEQGVVELLGGGPSMAGIPWRESVTERARRKTIRAPSRARAPEATGAFVATPMSRLFEALVVGFDAMSGGASPSVDRVARMAPELDRYHRLGGGARGTETRRKVLERLVSGAGTAPAPLLPFLAPLLKGGSGSKGPRTASPSRPGRLEAAGDRPAAGAAQRPAR